MNNETHDLPCTKVLTVNDTHSFSRKNRLELQSLFKHPPPFSLVFRKQFAFWHKILSLENPISRYVYSVFAHHLTNKLFSKISNGWKLSDSNRRLCPSPVIITSVQSGNVFLCEVPFTTWITKDSHIPAKWSNTYQKKKNILYLSSVS